MSDTLSTLATRINAQHAAFAHKAKDAIGHAIKAGKLLNEAKDKVPHGEWLGGLRRECPDISERTASRYMLLASHRFQTPVNAN